MTLTRLALVIPNAGFMDVLGGIRYECMLAFPVIRGTVLRGTREGSVGICRLISIRGKSI